MSKKIKDVEKRLKNPTLSTSNLLSKSSTKGVLGLKKNTEAGIYRSSNKLIKPAVLNAEQLRSSCDDGNNFGAWLA